MALPSGYTKLDYIESSGTQYINTGFKPNQNTRCVMDIENLSSAQTAFFGARANQNAASFTYFSLTATTGRSDYGSSKQSMSFTNTVGRYTVDQNKNVCTANGVTATGTANTFQLTHNLYLMAVNQANAAIQNAKMKLYSAKVYDNGTLVRDFIPCKNASGTIGLWDNVNSVFYTNAGTGTFSTGKKHKTMIDGAGYEIKSGRVLIAGTGYDIKKGRTLIGGTGYDIKFGVPVGELAVGTSVYLNVGGVRKEWIVVEQGKPDDSFHDDTCIGTWLLMKNIYNKQPWNNTTGNSNYNQSTICAYANETFLSLLDPQITQLIKTANIPRIRSRGDETKYALKCFLLHPYELGCTNRTADYDYAALSYFADNAASKRIAYYNNIATEYWTREGYLASGFSSVAVYIETSGEQYASPEITFANGFRPALILPPEEALFDSGFNIVPA